MKRRQMSSDEPYIQDIRTASVLNAPPSLVPAAVETMLFSGILLLLFLGGIAGCLVTGFSIPVDASILCVSIPVLSVLVLFGDRILKRKPLLYILPILFLFIYFRLRIAVIYDGFMYIATAVLHFLCWGFPGLEMPHSLVEYEQHLIHAETNDLLYVSIRAPITETVLVLCIALSFIWIFLYQHNQNTWLAAALPLPIFILCFLIIETTVPAHWALLLMLLYWIILLFTRTAIGLHTRAASSQALVLLLPCVLFLSAVYLWYPQKTPVGELVQNGYDKVLNTVSAIETSVFDAAGSLFSGRLFTVSAEGSEISFQSLGPRRFFGRTVMRAKSDTPGVIYLRENTYGTYTDEGWKQTDYDGVMFPDGIPSIQHASATILSDLDITAARLSLDGARSPLMFTPYYFSDATVDYAFDGDSRMTNPGRKTDYSISFYRFPGNFADLQYDTPAAAAASVQLVQYRTNTVSVYQSIDPTLAKELRAILADAGITPSDFTETFVFDENNSIRIVTDHDAMWDLIADITYFVRSAAEYSLNADRNTSGRDFVLWFLEDAEYGYCTHFATAEVMLLRACGIPARLASGFIGSIRTADSWTAIKDSNAHAWTEVFDVRLGWIPVESTPPGSATDGVRANDIIVGITPIPTSGDSTADTEEDSMETDAVTTSDTTETQSEETDSAPTQPNQSEQSGAVSEDHGIETAGSDSGSGDTVQLSRILRIIGTILLAVIGIGILLYIPILLRRIRQRSVSALFLADNEMRNTCALRLYRRCVSLARACGETLPANLTALAEKARFSQHTVTQGELDVMVEWYQSKCSQLQTQDKPLPRLRHFWFDVYY